MTTRKTSEKDIEMELRIARVETILGSVIRENGDAPLKKLWADTLTDVIRLFPESRVR